MNYPKRRPNTSPEALARRRAMIEGLSREDQITVIVMELQRQAAHHRALVESTKTRGTLQ